jgi:DNA-binding NarL/FixJ family response regulator
MFLFNIDNPIRIIFADDHEIVRAGIKRLLSVDKVISIVDEGSTGSEAVELVRKHKPHIALLDILMPKMTGIEAARIIKSEFPEVFVIMLSAFEDAEHLDQALSAGADGYLSKEISAKDLNASIHQVLEGYKVFSKTILEILNNRYSFSETNDTSSVAITKRELEVILVQNK